jgi:hypothetical protein
VLLRVSALEEWRSKGELMDQADAATVLALAAALLLALLLVSRT